MQANRRKSIAPLRSIARTRIIAANGTAFHSFHRKNREIHLLRRFRIIDLTKRLCGAHVTGLRIGEGLICWHIHYAGFLRKEHTQFCARHDHQDAVTRRAEEVDGSTIGKEDIEGTTGICEVSRNIDVLAAVTVFKGAALGDPRTYGVDAHGKKRKR